MKIVQVFQPQRGSIRRISLKEKLTLSLNFDISAVETMQEGNDLLFVFPDGSIVLLEEFYSTKHSPMFLLANGEIVQSFEDMMASADANLPQIDTSTEGLQSSSQDVLSLPVSAGGSEVSNGGLGEYRDGTGSMVGGINRLGFGDGITIDGNSSVTTFPSQQIEPSQLPGMPTTPPPQNLDPIKTWKDVVESTTGQGLTSSVSLFPNVNLGSQQKYDSIELTFGEGWGTSSNDTISINGTTFTSTSAPQTVTIGSLTISLSWSERKLTITQNGSGEGFSREQVNQILSSFGYSNSDIGNLLGMFNDNSSDSLINFEFLKKLQTGFKGLTITLTSKDSSPAETVSANLEFRELLNLGSNSNSSGVNTVIGAGASSTGSGGSASLSSGKDWAVIGSGQGDTISITGEGLGRYHLVVGGGGSDSIHAVSSDNYFIVGNGTYDSVNGTVNALDTTVTGSNTIITGSGNDTIIGGSGNDSINAGLGYNWILTGNATTGTTTVVLNGNTGSTNTIIMTSSANDESLYIDGSLIDDTILSQGQTASNNKNDKVTVSGGVYGGVISLGDGTDLVDIKESMTAGVIELGAGADTVSIGGALNNGSISTGGDADVIHIQQGMSGGIIDSGEGDDSITVSGNMSGGTITSSSGNNQIVIGSADGNNTMTGGSISLNGTNGNSKDSVTVYGDMSGGVITTKDGADRISVTGTVSGFASIHSGAYKDGIEIGAMAGGTVDAGLGDDTVYIVNTMSGGTIYGGGGNDAIVVGGGVAGGFIDAGDGTDLILLGGTVSGGSIYGGAGADYVAVVGNVTGGTIYGGADNDTIRVTGDVGIVGTECGTGTGTGVLAGGDGDDSISIEGNLYAGTVSGGAGNDSISISGVVQGGVIEALEGTNTITIGSSIGCGTISIGGDSNQLTVGSVDFVEQDSITVDANTTIMSGGAIDASQAKNASIILHGDMIAGAITLGAGVDTTSSTLDIHGSVGDRNTVDTVSATINSRGGNSINIHGRVQNGASIVLSGEESVGGDRLEIGLQANSTSSNTINDVMTGGTIDARTSSANNTIILHKNMTGGSIFGGSGADIINVAGTLTNGSIDAGGGNDLIAIKESVSGATLAGGAGTDFIAIGGDATSSSIDGGEGDDFLLVQGNVTNSTISSGSGMNLIGITGTVSNSRIDGGEGKDVIFIEGTSTTNSGLILSSGGGDDEINIAGSITGSTIDGGAGNDNIVIGGTVSNSTIIGGAGNDSISVNSMQSGTLIEGGAGEDRITITSGMSGGTLSSGSGNDSINIGGTLSGGVVKADEGDDTISMGNMTAGTVSGGTGNDSITLDTLSGGTVYADAIDVHGTGKNTISIQDMSNGNVYAGYGDSTLSITGNMSNGTIYLEGGNNNITIGTISDGTINLAGESNILNITTMSGGTINGSAGRDIVTISTMSGGTLNLGAGLDEVTINAMSNATVNMQPGSNSLTATITGSGVTINTSGSSEDTNTITLKLADALPANDTVSFNDVKIKGSDATDILDISGIGAGKTIKIENMPSFTDIELVKMGGATLDLSTLDNHTASTKFGANSSFKVEITNWNQVNFGSSTDWKKVDGQDNTYRFEKEGVSVTITFVGPEDGTISGTAPTPSTSTTKTLNATEDAQSSTIQGTNSERESQESRTGILEATAATMALALGEKILSTVFEEHTNKGNQENSTMLSSTQSASSLSSMNTTASTQTEPIQEEVVVDSAREEQSNILGTTQEDLREENVILLSPEYVVEEPILPIENIDVVDQFIVANEIVAPIELSIDTLYFEEEVLEEMHDSIQKVENTSEEDDYSLLPEEAEIELEVTIADLLVEHESTDIPREEVEVTEELYNSVEGDKWYASHVTKPSEAQEESATYTVDDTQGIQFASQEEEAPVFTLEEVNIIAFELQTPSMEIQYDEQAY